MWFRNLRIYRLPVAWTNADRLTEQLARGPFVPTSGSDPQSRGWVAPRPGSDLVHVANGHWLLCLQTETRLLPAGVVNTEVRRQADKLAELQGYGPGRKQLKELRERVVAELLPKSHTVQARTYAWIDPLFSWLCIDASTDGKADALIEHLRHCLDEFPVSYLHTQLSPTSAMADWLGGLELPDGFSIDHDCQVKGKGEEKATVTYQHHPIDGMTEIRGQLAKGLLPTRLAMTWDDRISFVLTEKLEVKRLSCLDLLKEEAEQHADTVDDQFDADFAIMTGELVRFLAALVEALGGEVEP